MGWAASPRRTIYLRAPKSSTVTVGGTTIRTTGERSCKLSATLATTSPTVTTSSAISRAVSIGAMSLTISNPVIFSRTREFGVTDLGAEGISSFFSQHECNGFCPPNWTQPADPKTIFSPHTRHDDDSSHGSYASLPSCWNRMVLTILFCGGCFGYLY